MGNGIGNENNSSRAMTTREGFGVMEVSTSAELSTRAAAEQARAMVEARYVMAMRFQRSMDEMRSKILAECQRSQFAESAIYAKPMGGKDEEGKQKMQRGFSIRFAEACARAYRNIDVRTFTIHDDIAKRIVRQSVTDLEVNTSFERDITIEKTVERRSGKNRTVIKGRKNTWGDDVYIVEATDDEFMTKEASLVSKAMRENILRLIPGDIKDECWRTLENTLAAEDKRDPTAKRKQVLDSYSYYNIGPQDLALYLGHPTEKATPDELRQLIQIYNAMREGSTHWAEVMEERLERQAAAAEARAAGAKVENLRTAIPEMKAFVAERADNLAPAEFRRIVGKTHPDLMAGSAADLRDAYDKLRATQSPTNAVPHPPPAETASPGPLPEDPGGGQAPSTNDAPRSGANANQSPTEAHTKSEDGDAPNTEAPPASKPERAGSAASPSNGSAANGKPEKPITDSEFVRLRRPYCEARAVKMDLLDIAREVTANKALKSISELTPDQRWTMHVHMTATIAGGAQ